MRSLFSDALNGFSYPITSIHPMPLASPPPTSPLTFTPWALSSTTPFPSTPSTAISSCSSTVPPTSSSPPLMPPPTTPSLFTAPLSPEAPLCPMPFRGVRCNTYSSFVNLDAVGMSVVLGGGGRERRGEGWGDGEGVQVGPGMNMDVVATNDDVADSGVGGQQSREGEEKVRAMMEEEPGWGQGHMRMLWRPMKMWLGVMLGNDGWEMERGRLGWRLGRRML